LVAHKKGIRWSRSVIGVNFGGKKNRHLDGKGKYTRVLSLKKGGWGGARGEIYEVKGQLRNIGQAVSKKEKWGCVRQGKQYARGSVKASKEEGGSVNQKRAPTKKKRSVC